MRFPIIIFLFSLINSNQTEGFIVIKNRITVDCLKINENISYCKEIFNDSTYSVGLYISILDTVIDNSRIDTTYNSSNYVTIFDIREIYKLLPIGYICYYDKNDNFLSLVYYPAPKQLTEQK